MSHELRALSGSYCRFITIHFINDKAYELVFVLHRIKAMLLSPTSYWIL